MIGDSPGQQQVDLVGRMLAERDALRSKLAIAVEALTKIVENDASFFDIQTASKALEQIG